MPSNRPSLDVLYPLLNDQMFDFYHQLWFFKPLIRCELGISIYKSLFDKY